MARVYIDSETGNWVHADTGNQIRAWDVRNTEPHASEVKRRASAGVIPSKYPQRIAGNMTDQSQPWGDDVNENEPPVAPVPSGDFTQVEERYVEEILRDNNYV